MDLGLLGMDFNLTLLACIMARMVGCIYFNPIFGQRTVPGMVKAALTLFLSIFVYTALPEHPDLQMSLVTFGVVIVKEILVGFFAGLVIRMFMSIVTMGGELIDFNIGMAMAKIYDPTQKSQIAITGSLLNIMFIVTFFATNSHLTMIKLFCLLGEISPYGEFAITQDFLWQFVELLSLSVLYAIKLTLPIIAVEIIVEMSMGLLMKAVPNIEIFVINIQVKIMLGFVCIFILVPSYANFLEKIMDLMFDKFTIVFGMG